MWVGCAGPNPSPGEGGFGAEKHNFDHSAALPISVNTNMRQASDALWNFIPLANDLLPLSWSNRQNSRADADSLFPYLDSAWRTMNAVKRTTECLWTLILCCRRCCWSLESSEPASLDYRKCCWRRCSFLARRQLPRKPRSGRAKGRDGHLSVLPVT